jgi:hypothetical protein
MDSSNRANNYESTWTRRFIGAAIIQGAIIVGLTVILILNQISILKPEVSRVIAVGGSGFNAVQAHEILGPLVEPISAAILVLVAGVVAGGIGFLLMYIAKSTDIKRRIIIGKRIQCLCLILIDDQDFKSIYSLVRNALNPSLYFSIT